MPSSFETDARLILSDAHGVYIPQLFCAGMDESDARLLEVEFSDVVTCQSGPDSESYYECWQSILDNARIIDDRGKVWRLWQDGDLWEIPDDCEIPDLF